MSSPSARVPFLRPPTCRTRRPPGALAPIAAGLGLCLGAGLAQAQPIPKTRPTPTVAVPRAEAASAPSPVTLTADEVLSHIGGESVAAGDVVLQRDDTVVTADHLTYDQRDDRARATGHVRTRRGGDWFNGDALDLQLTRSIGEIHDAEYGLGRTGAGGRAQRIDIQSRDRASATLATYTSCPRDGSGDPDWILTGDRIDVDTAHNEGRATGAVLRFLGLPILALPTLSFPVTSDRKSGWLPPTGDFDNRSGLQVGVPYYWNLAPQHDLTLSPQLMTKRGAALAAEFRYLEAHDLGQVTLKSLPDDRVFGASRAALQWAHEGSSSGGGVQYAARWQRVTDDTWWKDFPHQLPSLTPRLLPLSFDAGRHWSVAGADTTIVAYARVQRWQTLQDTDPTATIVSPYQRSPQVGLRGDALLAPRLDLSFEAEANRFDLSNQTTGDTRHGGLRAHVATALGREFATSWGRFEPRLAVNAAAYDTDEPMTDGRRTATRFVPTLSVDSQLSFERDTRLFDHALRQTLEPRLLYVFTPYRPQSTLPLYDTAPQDFNTASIFSQNAFTGVDRISDANQVTAGATTRFNDLGDGRELLRLGVAQRFLFRDQRITPDDGPPATERFSDLLLWGSSAMVKDWNFDGTVQFTSNTSQTARTILSTRYHPGPFQTLSATFRYARGASEQYELGWQWPVYRREGGARAGAGNCAGTLYAVGRVNYSVPDSRVTYSVGGFEYDAGCWVGRVIVERQSTGRSETNTHFMIQLELVGLSSLGTGSLKLLKDNIPGYQPLRDDSAAVAPHPNPP